MLMLFFQVGLAGVDGSSEEAGKAIRLDGLDVRRQLLMALVAEEHAALMEDHRPGVLLLPKLLQLEPKLLQIGGHGGNSRVRSVRGRRC